MSCSSVQKQLSAYLDGQVSETEAQAALKHAKSCKECGAVFADFRNIQDKVITCIAEKHPSPEIWPNIQLRINTDKIVTSKKSVRYAWFGKLLDRFFIHQPAWTRVTALATVVLIAVVIGFKAWHSDNASKETQIANTIKTLESSYDEKFFKSKKASEEYFQQRLGDFLQKSDLVLTEIKNYQQPIDVKAIDFTPEKTISNSLVRETRFLKKRLPGTQYEYLQNLVCDLEMVFLDIANLDEANVQDEIDILSGAIAQKDLLTKINIIKIDNRKKLIPRKKSGKIGAWNDKSCNFTLCDRS